MPSKLISIRRRESKSSIYQPTVIASSKKFLAAVMEGRAVLRGVGGNEEKALLGKLLGIDPAAPTFATDAKNYWLNKRLDVPHDGIELEIGMDSDNEPLNADHYLTWKWALKHKRVANSQEQMYNDASKEFYIYDPEIAMSKSANSVSAKARAYGMLQLMAEDEQRLLLVMRLLGEMTPEKMSHEARMVTLGTYIENDASRFVSVAEDKNAEIKDLLYRLRAHEVVRQVGNSFFYGEEKIASNEDEAVLFLKDPSNHEVLVSMRGKMGALGYEVDLSILRKKSAAKNTGKFEAPSPTKELPAEVPASADLQL